MPVRSAIKKKSKGMLVVPTLRANVSKTTISVIPQSTMAKSKRDFLVRCDDVFI
jgi:hypothetical protein